MSYLNNLNIVKSLKVTTRKAAGEVVEELEQKMETLVVMLQANFAPFHEMCEVYGMHLLLEFTFYKITRLERFFSYIRFINKAHTGAK